MALTEWIGYLAATLTTASFLPQAILTLRTRDTRSLSLGMYSLFTSGVLLWLIYGLAIADKAIIAANAVTLLLAASILFCKIQELRAKKKYSASAASAVVQDEKNPASW